MFKRLFKNKYKNLYKFVKYYKKEKNIIAFLIIVMIFASSLGMALPYFYSKRLVGIADNNFSTVITYSIVIISIITFHHIFWYLWEKLASVLTNRVANKIRSDIIEKIVNIKYADIKYRTSGYYLERVNDDTIEVSSFLSIVLGTLVDTLTNCSFLILIFVLNYKCGLLFFIGIVFLYVIDLLKIKKDLKYTEQLKILNEKFNSKVNENIKGIKDIKGLGIKDDIVWNTVLISQKISDTQIKKDRTYALFSRIKTYNQYVIEALIIVYSVCALIPNGSMSTVILLMILNYTGFMYDLVGYITNMKDHFIKSEYKAGRLLEILENRNIDEFGKLNNKIDNFSVSVKKLSYSYEENKNVKVLDNISLNIKENTTSIFIGSSGSGKSTLFGILSKLLAVEDGKVFINNLDINEISEKTFRDNICIINQEPFLLNDTIYNNLKIVNKNATKDEIINACKLANIYDEIMKLEDGIDTLIVENGTNLSGGQKQRIAIARAISKNSKILLFDEPTSALDKENQELFFNTITNLKENKTILIIAHKFNDLSIFDNVFELQNGCLKII